jgi:hypothetical protein
MIKIYLKPEEVFRFVNVRPVQQTSDMRIKKFIEARNNGVPLFTRPGQHDPHITH